MGHNHAIIDGDARFVIEASTRAIKHETARKVVLVQNDHNSERFTFECTRYVEGHDLSVCNRVQVHYLAVDGNRKNHTGLYEVEDLAISTDDENLVTCSWLISQNATKHGGKLSFLLRFGCVEGETVHYAWHTLPYTEVSISNGIDASEAFETEYVEIIERWKNNVMQHFTNDLTAWKIATASEIREEAAGAINAKYAEIGAELDAERKRIDSFVALKDGSTTGDAELQDIRVGYDGRTHNTAGQAVRSQVKYLAEGTGLAGVYEWSLTANTATLVDVIAGETYIFELLPSEGLSTVTIYFDDASGNSTPNRGYKAGDTAIVTIPDGTVRVKFWVTVSAPCTFKVVQYTVRDYSMDARIRSIDGRVDGLENRYPLYDRIIGATTGKIHIDTEAKTVSMEGLFFFENGNWRNFTSPVTLDLTTHTPNEKGETVRIVLDANGKLAVRNILDGCNSKDTNICLIMITGTWFFDTNKVYADTVTQKILYVNGNVLHPDVNKLSKEINRMSNGNTGKSTCKIFKRVCCCGDSFTSGHIADPSGEAHPRNEDFAWPHYMATATGNEWINCGQSGANVLTWQTNYNGLVKARNSGKVQAYVIGLMINDQSSGTDRYVELGSIDDIGTEAQTYYGGMSKIICELNTISPDAKIFVLTCPQTGGLYPSYNQAVYDIVSAYEGIYPVHCLDLLANKDMYAVESLTSDAWYGHYTAIGYEQFAEILSVIMSDYINAHIKEFQNVPFIEYDKE